MDREGRATEDDAGRSCRLQVGVACISVQTFWRDPGGRKQRICCIFNHHGCFEQFPVIYCHYLLFVYKKHIAMQSSILSLECLPYFHGISSSACFAPPTNPGWSLFISRRRPIQSELLLVRRWRSSLVTLTPSSSSYSPVSPSQLQRARWPIPTSLLHLRQIVRCLQVSNTTSGQDQSSVVFCPA